MSSRTLINLILLALIGGLVLLLVMEPGMEPDEAQTHTITGLDETQITRIHIERHDREPITLERRADSWWLTQPLEVRASDFLVQNILKLSQARSQVAYAADGLELAPLALEQPHVRLWLNDTELAFGDLNPLELRRYVRVGDQVYMVSEAIFNRLSGEFTEFVSTALLPPDSRVESLHLPGLSLQRKQGNWALDPEQTEVSADSRQALVDEWRHSRAMAVTAYNSQAKVQGSVRILLQDQATPLQFDILSTTPELILGRPDLGLQYQLPQSSYLRLFTLTPATDEDRGEVAATD